MNTNEQIDFFKKSLTGLVTPTNQVIEFIDKLRRLIDPIKLDIDERTERFLILSLHDDLIELSRKIKYLNSPVISEGTILKNGNGYSLNGKPIEIGDRFEILVLDDAEQCYTFAEVSVGFWDDQYYAVEFPSVPLHGTKARIRVMTSDSKG